MHFKRVNYKNLKLTDKSQVPKFYIRLVEKGTREAQYAVKAKTNASEATSENDERSEKDFLATALGNCQKFNEEFEGTFDK